MTQELISSILSENMFQATEAFDQILSDKISTKLSEAKIDVAQGLFGGQLDEAVSIPMFPETHKQVKPNGIDTLHTTKTPVGERPKGAGWELHRSGQQRNEPHDVWKSTSRKVSESIELDEAKNPKIDLYHNGVYKVSTTRSPTVKHAVAGYKAANPDLVGEIKGARAD